MEDETLDVLVIGGGPSGVHAAIAAVQDGWRVGIVDQMGAGGRVINFEKIADFPMGDPDEMGAVVASQWLDKALELGINITFDLASGISKNELFEVQCSSGEVLQSRSVVLATGHLEGTLGLAEEENLEGCGLSHCASCDGPLYQGQTVVVAGGSDWAVEEALHLATFASRVILAFPEAKLDCTVARKRRVEATSNIECMANSTITKLGVPDGKLSSVTVSSEDDEQTIEVMGLFPSQGWKPNSSSAPKDANIAEDGRVMTDENFATNVPGFFAVGDVTRSSNGFVAQSIGDGTAAGVAVSKYLALSS